MLATADYVVAGPRADDCADFRTATEFDSWRETGHLHQSCHTEGCRCLLLREIRQAAMSDPAHDGCLVGYMYIRNSQPASVAQLVNDPWMPAIERDFPIRGSNTQRVRVLGL